MVKTAIERRSPRYETDSVHGSFACSVDAVVSNISLNGLGVQTSTQLHVGREYSFRLGEGKDQFLVSGKVAWCHLSRTEKRPGGDIVPVYKAGIGFSEVLNEKATRLLEFMQKHVVLTLQQRILGRFSLAENDSILLESKNEFGVRQISRSGMLIDTAFGATPESVIEMELLLGTVRVPVTGRVVEVREVAGEGGELRFLTGIQFVFESGSQRQALEKFIREELEQGAKLGV